MLLLLLTMLIAEAAPPTSSPAPAEPDAFALNALIGRGINIGNALEAPSEGEWGITIKEEYFDIIRRAGFNSVRVPVCWSAHALTNPPFTIAPLFLKRIDDILNQANRRGFVVILTMHHYNELYHDPARHTERFLGLWQQLAERYQNQPFKLLFEPLNEPHDKLDDSEWNRLLKAALKVIRQTNPTRKVVLGSANYNGFQQLDVLELPPDDSNLIATFHYYLPYEFTHQGAHWAPGSAAWLGRKWTGSDSERQALYRDLFAAAEWGKRHHRPILLGEFGANSKAEMDSRVRWTRAVAQTALDQGMSYTYWDFCAQYFGVYDPQLQAWRQSLLEAVLGASP